MCVFLKKRVGYAIPNIDLFSYNAHFSLGFLLMIATLSLALDKILELFFVVE